MRYDHLVVPVACLWYLMHKLALTASEQQNSTLTIRLSCSAVLQSLLSVILGHF